MGSKLLDTTNSITIVEALAFEQLLSVLPKDKFTSVSIIGRGGLSVAQKIAYKLDVPVKMYENKEHLILVPDDSLFVDDIVCTGDTIGFLTGRVRVATLVQRASAKIKADYAGVVLDSNEYVTFSWEAYMRFKDERSCNTEESTRYGKNIIDNFDVNEDLVFWKMQEEYTKNGYLVTMIHPEISALCPVSGYPDSGKVTVQFVPNDHTVELKAFKLWLNSYRNVNISHEGLANEIFNILTDGLKPKKLYVKLEMMPRGNVTTIVEVGEV